MLSVFRIVMALLYLQHPLAKFFGFPHVAAFDNLQPFSLIWVAGVIEIICAPLLLIGLFTRLAAFILSGEMAVAYFMVHAPRGFFPWSLGAKRKCFIVLLSSIWRLPAPACGASTTPGGIHHAKRLIRSCAHTVDVVGCTAAQPRRDAIIGDYVVSTRRSRSSRSRVR